MGLLTPCSVPRGGLLCTTIVPRGEGFCSLQVVSRGFVSGGGGVVLDEIDTCISWVVKIQMCIFLILFLIVTD